MFSRLVPCNVACYLFPEKVPRCEMVRSYLVHLLVFTTTLVLLLYYSMALAVLLMHHFFFFGR